MRTVLQLFTIAVLLACAPAVHAQEESSEDTTKSTVDIRFGKCIDHVRLLRV
jgi:hypothetical protein